MTINDDTEPRQKCYNTAVYMNMLQTFVEIGEYEDADLHRDDALAHYLLTTMADPVVRCQVLGCAMCARIFIDTMIQFVSLNLQKAQYRRQRVSAEQQQIDEAYGWSLVRRQNGWRALLQQVAENYNMQGFERDFYQREFADGQRCADDGAWHGFLNEWQRRLDAKLEAQRRNFIDERRELQDRLLRNNLKAAPEYVERQGVPESDFFQTWALMGGRWNSLEFERLHKTVLLQRKYKVLTDVAQRMGRKADADGMQRISIISGADEQLKSASKSDIVGIGSGRDLHLLLPHELALYMDEDTEDVFFQKYVTNHLQIFDYQSRLLKSARSLHTKAARPKGPMVVCVDRSGSMMGEPGQISLSLMMLLCEMCEKDKRDCYLIAFSVHARPIDVMRDRTQLLRFFRQSASGNTDAREMTDATCSLLHTNSRYMAADVLWITDFRIPMLPDRYLQDMKALRRQGTRFYGLQIGVAENVWKAHFDEVFSITDVKMPVT